MSGLRVAVITPQWTGTKGGPTTYVKNLSERMRAAGHAVTVMTPDEGEGALKFSRGTFKSLLEIAKLLRGLDPDVVHVHVSLKYVIPVLISRWMGRTGCRLVYTIHTAPTVRKYLEMTEDFERPYRGMRALVAELLLNRCDAVTSVSQSIVDAYRELLGISIKKCEVVPSAGHPLPLDQSELSRLRSLYRLDDYSPILCTLGVLSWDWKVLGHQICVRAMALLREKYKNAVLLIAGDGLYRDYLEKVVEDEGRGAPVILLGNIDSVPEFLELADVYLHMAVNEGCPHAVIEAMYAGRPIVAANAGGIPEIITDGVTGLLIEPDARELSDKLELLLQDEERMRLLGENAALFASSHLTWEAVCSRYLELYEGKSRAGGYSA